MIEEGGLLEPTLCLMKSYDGRLLIIDNVRLYFLVLLFAEDSFLVGIIISDQ